MFRLIVSLTYSTMSNGVQLWTIRVIIQTNNIIPVSTKTNSWLEGTAKRELDAMLVMILQVGTHSINGRKILTFQNRKKSSQHCPQPRLNTIKKRGIFCGFSLVVYSSHRTSSAAHQIPLCRRMLGLKPGLPDLIHRRLPVAIIHSVRSHPRKASYHPLCQILSPEG
jgi:hypothetical protein